MTDILINIAKGRFAEFCNLPAASDSILVVLLKGTVQVDDTLNNHVSLATLLAANTECDFTNYVRKTVTASVTVTFDNTANSVSVDMPDLTWTSAGAAVIGNNTITAAIICYSPATGSADSAIVPITKHTLNSTTTGTDFLLQLNAAGFAGST